MSDVTPEIQVDHEYNDDEDNPEDDEYEGLQPVSSEGPIKWVKGHLIFNGSFGIVHLGMDTSDGSLMAVEQVPIPMGKQGNEERKKSALTALQRDIEHLKALKHDNIVRYLYCSSDPKDLYIHSEYVPGGPLAGLLKTYGPFEEALVRNFVRQILLGLDFLHERGIIHRDIKGANILVDNRAVIKISNFGISEEFADYVLIGPRAERSQRSVYWMAPEVVNQDLYTDKADIWSLGAVMVECLTGAHPWADLSPPQATFRIGTSATPVIPEDVSRECHDFISRTFVINHLERPCASELHRHPFVAEGELRDATDGD